MQSTAARAAIGPASERRVGADGASAPLDPCAESASLTVYIAEMTAELAGLAGRAGLPMLAYFLNLARVEAEIQARERGGVEVERRS